MNREVTVHRGERENAEANLLLWWDRHLLSNKTTRFPVPANTVVSKFLSVSEYELDHYVISALPR